MFYLEGNEINITKGDTAIINFELENHNFVSGDKVYFTVKRSPKDKECIINKLITNFEGNKVSIPLSSSDTKIDKGKYWYDIQCTLLDGRVDTVINKERFIVYDEIHVGDEDITSKDEITAISSDTDYQFNVKHYGVKVGNDVDVAKNTEIIQDLINKHDDLVLYFPSGIYRLNSLDLGVNKNITFLGKSSAFATSVNKDIANPRIIDTYSKIVVDLPENEYFLNHTNCTVIVDKISFINGNVSDSNDITVSQNNYFIKTITNSNKGKVFCTDSSFIGWKQVGGDPECLTKENELLHCCFMANRTRFTENIIAIGNPLDSRLVDCTFNKNNYAIVSNKNSGFTTVNGCRIEWNRINGIKLINSKEFIITSCEFDRQGYSALSIEKSTRCTISNNVFRRNGANEELTIEDNINNCHMYLSENEEMIVTGNITLAKSILDTSGAKERPTFSATVVNNNWITFKDNSLRGCTKKDKEEAFIRSGNINCCIENNMTMELG